MPAHRIPHTLTCMHRDTRRPLAFNAVAHPHIHDPCFGA